MLEAGLEEVGGLEEGGGDDAGGEAGEEVEGWNGLCQYLGGGEFGGRKREIINRPEG